jgi:hypothetical protein
VLEPFLPEELQGLRETAAILAMDVIAFPSAKA